MKKTLLASALLLGFSSIASAASSVTLYGTVDVGAQQTESAATFPNCSGSLANLTVFAANEKPAYSCDGTKKTYSNEYSLTSGAKDDSMLGFKGVRDLGVGVQGLFQIEASFDLTNNLGSFSIKNGFVGISSVNWGTITIGKQGNAFDQLAVGDAMDGLTSDNYFDGVTGKGLQPGIKYVSPEFFGLQLGVSWSGTNTREEDDDLEIIHDNNYSLGLAFNYSGLSLSAGVYDNYRSTTRGKEYNRYSWMLGASYDFGPVAVYGRYAKVSQSYIANFINSDTYKQMQNAAKSGALLAEATRLSNEINNLPDVKPSYDALMKLPADQRKPGSSEGAYNYGQAFDAHRNDYNDKYQAFAKTAGAVDPSFQMFSIGVSVPFGETASFHLEWQHGVAKDLATGNAVNVGVEGQVADGLTLYLAAGSSKIKNSSGNIKYNDANAKIGLSYSF